MALFQNWIYVRKRNKGDKMKIHSFGKTDPNHKHYGKQTRRTPLCGITVEKEFVTNKDKEVTCGLCLKLMKLEKPQFGFEK